MHVYVMSVSTVDMTAHYAEQNGLTGWGIGSDGVTERNPLHVGRKGSAKVIQQCGWHVDVLDEFVVSNAPTTTSWIP